MCVCWRLLDGCLVCGFGGRSTSIEQIGGTTAAFALVDLVVYIDTTGININIARYLVTNHRVRVAHTTVRNVNIIGGRQILVRVIQHQHMEHEGNEPINQNGTNQNEKVRANMLIKNIPQM